jgi:hypothetical protein
MRLFRAAALPCLLVSTLASAYAAGPAKDDVQRITAGKLAESPARWDGTRVRVTAEVERAYSAQVFTLDDDAAGPSPDVLVIVPRAVRAPDEESVATVTGSVRPFVKEALERDFRWLDFASFREQGIAERFRAHPVIVADSVLTDEGQELVEPAAVRTKRTRPGRR